MSGYIGASPVPQATQHREAFTATASQTSFPTAGYTPQFVDVYLNGVKLAAADYTATNGSDIVLTTGAALNDILEIVAYTPFEVADQTFTGTTTVDVLSVTGTATGTDLYLSGGVNNSTGIVSLGNAQASGIEVMTTTASAQPRLRPAADDNVDLGQPARRFQDIYLSGGVVFGTGGPSPITSNTLDDYEEGTFQADYYQFQGQGGTWYGNNTLGTYTKIGRVVTITFRANNVSSGATIQSFSGLPFAPADDSLSGVSSDVIGLFLTVSGSTTVSFRSADNSFTRGTFSYTTNS